MIQYAFEDFAIRQVALVSMCVSSKGVKMLKSTIAIEQNTRRGHFHSTFAGEFLEYPYMNRVH